MCNYCGNCVSIIFYILFLVRDQLFHVYYRIKVFMGKIKKN